MLVCFANPRSATAVLIQICNAYRNVLDLSSSTQVISPTAPCSPAAMASNNALYRVPASQTPRPLRPNLHSASGIPAVPSSRFPPLEVFVRRPRRAWNCSYRPASENLHRLGNPQNEQMLSALAQQPDSSAVDWHFRVGPGSDSCTATNPPSSGCTYLREG
jgi:hypothetical protein